MSSTARWTQSDQSAACPAVPLPTLYKHIRSISRNSHKHTYMQTYFGLELEWSAKVSCWECIGSGFHRPDALLVAQQTGSKHWQMNMLNQSTVKNVQQSPLSRAESFLEPPDRQDRHLLMLSYCRYRDAVSSSCCRRSWTTTTFHREPNMRRYPDPQHLWWQSFCSWQSRATEQFTATSQRCWLTVQSVPAVTKDIFVWIVGTRHSANYFNCAI